MENKYDFEGELFYLVIIIRKNYGLGKPQVSGFCWPRVISSLQK